MTRSFSYLWKLRSIAQLSQCRMMERVFESNAGYKLSFKVSVSWSEKSHVGEPRFWVPFLPSPFAVNKNRLTGAVILDPGPW